MKRIETLLSLLTNTTHSCLMQEPANPLECEKCRKHLSVNVECGKFTTTFNKYYYKYYHVKYVSKQFSN